MESIKGACKIIELTIKKSVAKTESKSTLDEVKSSLKLFKTYVEIRILNALIKCIAKGLNTLVVMFSLTSKIMGIKGCDESLTWLFRINVSNIIPDVTLDPMTKDVVDQMKFLVTQIYDVSKFLPRFKNESTDSVVQSMFDLFKEEDMKDYPEFDQQDYTFYGDTKNHKILNYQKNKLEQYITEDTLNKIKQDLTHRKDKLKLTEIIELDDLKNNITEK